MATFNGEKYLADQLKSLENQSYKNWRLIISDDGSSDNTIAIAKKFQEKWGSDQLQIREGPRLGFCLNFLSMACDANIQDDLYAFSDQDDVWLTDKLERAINYFNQHTKSKLPTVYGSRTQVVDKNLKLLGYSTEFMLPMSFRNALVQSIAGGNTMLFNQATKKLLEQAGLQKVVSHDWWLYQLVKGAGGVFYYDPKPSILYRQHPDTTIGARASFKAKITRIPFVINGQFKKWNDLNYVALCNIRHLLTQDNQDILDIFGKYRKAKLKDRIRLLEVCGVYRQTWSGTLLLWLAIIINKI